MSFGGPKFRPQPPLPDESASDEARRRELAVQSKAGGRRSTMMTDYALAATPAPTLQATLGRG